MLVSAIATQAIHDSVNKISFLGSTMSPRAPAGRARTKNGKALAVCVSATYSGPAWTDTIIQAAPTLSMNVPTSEATSATRRLRRVGTRRGRQRLGISLGSWLATLTVCS
jgi:hypothetical protein